MTVDLGVMVLIPTLDIGITKNKQTWGEGVSDDSYTFPQLGEYIFKIPDPQKAGRQSRSAS